jgi:hypothetical protein
MLQPAWVAPPSPPLKLPCTWLQDVAGSPHSSSVRTSLGGGAPPSSQDSADIREEVEGLKNLIDRLSI